MTAGMGALVPDVPMLAGLRVLDLSDERGLLAGRLLSDLGADVVHVEPPEGSGGRREAPVVDLPDGTRGSLHWETFGAGRRSVCLDLTTEPGRAAFLRLCEAADVLLTSVDQQWWERRGIDPRRLEERFPTLVVSTVTGFGWDGPKSSLATSDLVLWAAGGPLAPHQDGERGPVRISAPQAWLHAGADAAAGVLTALRERRRSGRGQVVDVSAQLSVAAATLARVLADVVGDPAPDFQVTPTGRSDQSGSGAATPHHAKKWRCADGWIELHLSMGPAAGAFTNNVFTWIAETDPVDEDVRGWDWRELPARLTSGELDASDLERARASVRNFFATRTKAEVIEAALERRLLCMAIADAADVAASPHLDERGFFTTVEVDGRALRTPGTFAHVRGGPAPRLAGRAPRLGEHTDEVLAQWAAVEQPVMLAAERPEHGDGEGDALAGLKVLDLSWVVAGPLVGRSLADFGAEVVRVESSTRIETARLMQPFVGGVAHVENSALFGNCNAGKQGVTLDLGSEQGRELVLRLVDWADVVVESFAPGRLARWGLAPDLLRRRKPGLVVLSTCLAGQDGPWSALAGFGNVGSSLSGFQNLVGWPDGLPLGPFGPYTDFVGPRLALPLLLAALERRDRTGLGCHLDVAQLEAGAFFLSPQLAQHSWDETVAQRLGNADLVRSPHGVHRCLPEADPDGSLRDRFVAVAVDRDEQWPALAAVLAAVPGGAGLAERDELRDAAGRRAAAQELEGLVSRWASGRTAAQAQTELQAVGVPAHMASTPADFASDPQVMHRGHLVEVPSSRHGATHVEGPRWQMSRTPGRPRGAAPQLGEHNRVVLREILGITEDEIDHLVMKGVVR